MKIKDIRHLITNETRTDGRYPLRIGSMVDFLFTPVVGGAMYLSYICDNQGNDKEGVLRTSIVTKITESETEVIVTTVNSVYYLEK